jgi:hypothetical protein
VSGNKWLIQITGHPESLLFILVSQLIQGCGLSPIEEEILDMCKVFMRCLTPNLKEHSRQSNLVHNPDLKYEADLVQFMCITQCHGVPSLALWRMV